MKWPRPVDEGTLEVLESGIEASAEALVSMREARHRLAEVWKERGFKGPAGNVLLFRIQGQGQDDFLVRGGLQGSSKFPCFDWARPSCMCLGVGSSGHILGPLDRQGRPGQLRGSPGLLTSPPTVPCFREAGTAGLLGETLGRARGLAAGTAGLAFEGWRSLLETHGARRSDGDAVGLSSVDPVAQDAL